MTRAENISESIKTLLYDKELSSLDKGAFADLAEKFMGVAHKFFIEATKKILPSVYDHIKKEHPDVPFEEQAFIEAGESVVKNMNPKTIYEEVKQAVKKHGWKIGVIMAFWEVFEHFGIPAILSYLGYPALAVTTAVTPGIGELVAYPLFFKILGKLDKDKDKVLTEGFFDFIDPVVQRMYA